MIVSVILPVYNSERYLVQCLDSIVNQTLTDMEIICIDDKSTDNSLQILEKYAQKDSRILIIKNEVNLGIVESRNKGLDLAKGEFIAVMDSDDIAELIRFEIQVDFLSKNPNIGVCGSQIQKFGKVKRKINVPLTSEQVKACLCFNSCIMHPTAMLRADLINKYNLRYDKNYTTSHDYDFWTRCIDCFDIVNLPLVLLKYRVHEKNFSTVKISDNKEFSLGTAKAQMYKYGLATIDDDEGLSLLFGAKTVDKSSYPKLKEIYNKLSANAKESNMINGQIFNLYLKKRISKTLVENFKKTKEFFYLEKLYEYNKPRALWFTLISPIKTGDNFIASFFGL